MWTLSYLPLLTAHLDTVVLIKSSDLSSVAFPSPLCFFFLDDVVLMRE